MQTFSATTAKAKLGLILDTAQKQFYQIEKNRSITLLKWKKIQNFIE